MGEGGGTAGGGGMRVAGMVRGASRRLKLLVAGERRACVHAEGVEYVVVLQRLLLLLLLLD